MKQRLSVHLYISGIVQGVFFRACTRDVAVSLGLTGWVRNLSDGRVEVLAEGDKDKLEKLVNWCRKGPPGARVEDVEVAWSEPTGKFKKFEILYGYLNT